MDHVHRLRFGLQLSSFGPGPDGAPLAPRLAEVAAIAESVGFTSLWVMDHMVQIPQVGRPWEDMPESWTTLAWLAAHTRTVRLGTLALAMVSLGWVLVVSDMILQLKGLTGGVGGLVGISLRWSFNGPLASPVDTPILIFVVGWLTYLGHWWYRSSRFGRAALAARDEAIGAAVSGISISTVGLILMIIGVIGLVLSLFAMRRRRVVYEDVPVATRTREYY